MIISLTKQHPTAKKTVPAAALLLVGLFTCQCQNSSVSNKEPLKEAFVEVGDKVGLNFTHVHGGSGKKYFIEIMGAGGGFLDYDNDGWLDVYLVQGGPLAGYPDQTPLANKLFRNNRDGTFTDVTNAAGVGDTGYGMGCCFGDIDNDGFIDIFLANFGSNKLYRNNGKEKFTDITAQAGVSDSRWGTSCAFADYDADGFLDLYVATYVDFTLDNNIPCGQLGLLTYCHPDVYGGVPDVLYHNNGDGTFTDVTKQAGVYNDSKTDGKGLGVVWTDYDNDGDPDIYVANDSTPNFLYRNNGNGTFTDVAVIAGCAYNEMGMTEAGMGVDAGDIDGNGYFDLFITHLDNETNTLYRNNGDGTFDDWTDTTRLGPPSLPKVGFGTNFFDFDNDGDLDVFVTNGRVTETAALRDSDAAFAQSAQLFENNGNARFDDISNRAGSYFQTPWIGRGAAFGDVDNDGDVDILVTNCNQRALLLRNEVGNANNWIILKLAGKHKGRDAIGAFVKLVAGNRTQIEEVRSGSSYLSQGDLRLHFGLGKAGQVDRLEIRWPDGQVQTVSGEQVKINQITTIQQ